MELNKVHNIDFLNNDLPDKCAKLIIADPPYYKVKGDFDFIWKSFDDYLADVEKWAIECKRLLADNGTLLWYGDAKNIAYTQIIFDKHFNLLSNVTCHIFDRQTNKIPAEEARSFISTTERLLMYGKKYNVTECTTKDKSLFIELISKIQETAKVDDFVKCLLDLKIASSKESAKVLASYKLGKHKTRYDFLTEEMYNYIGGFNYSYLELESIYKKAQRPFNPTEKYKMDVLRVSQEGHITGKYEHDTVKPEKLTRILITTCSRENDLVVVPFAGSGTECAMSAKKKRPFIGYEITEKHAKMAQERADKILKEPTLF